ncbi:MAG: peptidylprolyl isomerase [Leptolyngbyaceae cyanobacterium]
MAVVLKVGNREVTADEVMPLMAGYQMLPKFLQEVIIDEAIADITCTPEEQTAACEQFYAQNRIAEEQVRQEWLKQYGMTQAQLENLAVRSLRIEKYKQETWGLKVESYFLERKGTLDKVIYSLIRTKDIGIAQEIYFRINDGEQTFAELAREYSQGPEADTDGLIGPVELSVPHASLAGILSRSKPGELSPPTRVGEWMVIVRLERFIPCQMDDAMRQRLLDEQFKLWLQEKMQTVEAVFAHANTEQTSVAIEPSLTESATTSTSETTTASSGGAETEQTNTDEAKVKLPNPTTDSTNAINSTTATHPSSESADASQPNTNDASDATTPDSTKPTDSQTSPTASP